ncbi:universal stress protein [Telmatobacter bradus]|uniref:universal stress protein n=1 Tax=Telmatobacter bradus TaxID=474953 RepID=UPI003B432475
MPEANLPRRAQPAVILVATDLADLERLMPHALDQANRTSAHLILLHALEPSVTLSIDDHGTPFYDPTLAISQAEKALQPWCEAATRRGVVCDAVVRDGAAARQIADAARQFRADRILIGTRNRIRQGKSPLGSVAEQVLRSVNLPVITVGPEAHLQDNSDDPIVLHATTLRETSRPSAALACTLASKTHARLVVMHVLPMLADGPRQGEPAALDEPVLEQLRLLAAETASGCCLEVEALVVHGNPFIEILAAASKLQAGMIILGLEPHSVFDRLTRDRTVYQVVAHARCPVLILREDPLPHWEQYMEEAAASRM